MLEVRPATLDDASVAAAIATQMHPDEPEGEAEMRHRWSVPDGAHVRRRWIAELDGEPVGFVFIGRPAEWPEGDRIGSIGVHLVPEAHRDELYDALLETAEAGHREAGATALRQWLREDDAFLIAAGERHGYRRDRLGKAWELDLLRHRGPLLAQREASRQAMRALGVHLLPLDRAPVGDALRRVYELDVATSEDIPRTGPHVPPTYDEYLAMMSAPGIRAGRVWTAWREDELVAISFLEFPSVGNVWTGYTACAAGHRGLGIARAVKMETLGQAIELGVPRVRTDNDEQNAAMLHINETLGYRRIPGILSYLRR